MQSERRIYQSSSSHSAGTVSYTHLDVYKRQQLTDDQKAKLLDVLKKISDLDLDWNTLKNQASDLYEDVYKRQERRF